MPKQFSNELDQLSEVFRALADPTRLAVVERLSVAPASTSELARPFAMALPSFVQHLCVMERAGILTSHKSGRVRTYQVAPGVFGQATQWLSANSNHWERRVDQLDKILAQGSPDDFGAKIASHERPQKTTKEK